MRHRPIPNDRGGGVRSFGGIYSGKMTEWADELGCDPEDVPGVLDDAGQILTDTGRDKREGGDGRPRDPEKRSIAVIPHDGLLSDD